MDIFILSKLVKSRLNVGDKNNLPNSLLLRWNAIIPY